jgi:hypothetical protein
MRPNQRINAALSSVVIVFTFASTSFAGLITANPDVYDPTIGPEMGYGHFRFSLSHTDPSYRAYVGTYQTPVSPPQPFFIHQLYSSGNGQIDTFNATLNSGNSAGHSVQHNNVGVYGDYYSTGWQSFYYDSPGTYTATLTGTANVRDYLLYSQYTRYSWNGSSYVYSGSGTSSPPVQPWFHSRSFGAEVDINVSNLGPQWAGFSWDMGAYVGDTVNFLARGLDPYGIGSTETLTFSYDFNMDGVFDYQQAFGGPPYQTPLTSSAQTVFNNAGTHYVRVRLTDDQGGDISTVLSVNVYNQPDAEIQGVPEPSTFALFGLASVGGMGLRWRQRRRENAGQAAA